MSFPRDESDLLCKTTTTSTTSTVAPTFPTIQTTYINIGFESEDLRLGTITSVSLAVLVGLGCCMVCCVKRCSRMSLPPTPTSDPDECHEMRLSGLPVGGHSSHHQRIIHRGGEGSANRYIEGAIGSDMLGGRDHNTGIIDIEGGEGGELPPRGNTPPPAYSEIFPEGYQHSLAKQTNKEDDHVESTDV